jgi:hypothetical protein
VSEGPAVQLAGSRASDGADEAPIVCGARRYGCTVTRGIGERAEAQRAVARFVKLDNISAAPTEWVEAAAFLASCTSFHC